MWNFAAHAQREIKNKYWKIVVLELRQVRARATFLARRPAQFQQAGFTIPELMVTIVFIGFAFIAVTELYLAIQNIQDQTTYVQIASHAAQTEIESLRNSNYNSLTVGQNIDFSSSLPSNLPSPRSGTVVVSSPMAGLARVDATVSYTDHGTQHQVELSSLIGVIGISQ